MPNTVRNRQQSRLWTPHDLGPSLCLWLDAGDLNTIVLNSGTVSQWRDKSGRGNSVTQSTAANQPTYVYGTGTTLPHLIFDGTTSNMATASNATLPIGNASRHMSAIVQPTSTTNARFYIAYGAAASSQGWSLGKQSSQEPNIDAYFHSATSTDALGTSQMQINADYANSGGNLTVYKNGILGTGGTTPTGLTLATPASILTVGSNFQNPTTNFMPMNAFEFIMVATALDPVTRAKLEGYQAWNWWNRYGVPNVLPATHPYKLQPPHVAA